MLFCRWAKRCARNPPGHGEQSGDCLNVMLAVCVFADQSPIAIFSPSRSRTKWVLETQYALRGISGSVGVSQPRQSQLEGEDAAFCFGVRGLRGLGQLSAAMSLSLPSAGFSSHLVLEEAGSGANPAESQPQETSQWFSVRSLT